MPSNSVSLKTNPNCAKCGAATGLLTSIPRLGAQLGYRIFECSTCKALTWIADAVSK